MPVLSIFTGKIDFSNMFIALDGNKYPTLAAANEVTATINYGSFITQAINFLLMAFVVFMVIKAINKLEKKGFVMRIRDDADRRIVRISLTEKGRAALERHEQFYYRIVDEAIRDMDNVQKRVLVRSMGHMADFFSAKLNQPAEETEAIGAEAQPGEERF